jgi:hypothetical protein
MRNLRGKGRTMASASICPLKSTRPNNMVNRTGPERLVTVACAMSAELVENWDA